MQHTFITALMLQFGPQILSLTLFVVGIVLSFNYRSKNPEKFLLTTIAFPMFFFISFAGPIFAASLMTQYSEKKLSAEQYIYSSQLFDLVYMLIWLIPWAILFNVIFNQKYNSVKTTNTQLSE